MGTGVGICSPRESAAKSRTDSVAAFSRLDRFMPVQAGSRKARRLPLRGFPGLQTRLDWRRVLQRGASCATTGTSEANMAPTSSGPGANAPKVTLHLSTRVQDICAASGLWEGLRPQAQLAQLLAGEPPYV